MVFFDDGKIGVFEPIHGAAGSVHTRNFGSVLIIVNIILIIIIFRKMMCYIVAAVKIVIFV
jgi:hypothetical protein